MKSSLPEGPPAAGQFDKSRNCRRFPRLRARRPAAGPLFAAQPGGGALPIADFGAAADAADPVYPDLDQWLEHTSQALSLSPVLVPSAEEAGTP